MRVMVTAGDRVLASRATGERVGRYSHSSYGLVLGGAAMAMLYEESGESGRLESALSGGGMRMVDAVSVWLDGWMDGWMMLL